MLLSLIYKARQKIQQKSHMPFNKLKDTISYRKMWNVALRSLCYHKLQTFFLFFQYLMQHHHTKSPALGNELTTKAKWAITSSFSCEYHIQREPQRADLYFEDVLLLFKQESLKSVKTSSLSFHTMLVTFALNGCWRREHISARKSILAYLPSIFLETAADWLEIKGSKNPGTKPEFSEMLHDLIWLDCRSWKMVSQGSFWVLNHDKKLCISHSVISFYVADINRMTHRFSLRCRVLILVLVNYLLKQGQASSAKCLVRNPKKAFSTINAVERNSIGQSSEEWANIFSSVPSL